MSSDILSNYLRSTHKNASALKRYADQLGNRAVYKRLGFLLEKIAPGEIEMIEKLKPAKSKAVICKESLEALAADQREELESHVSTNFLGVERES
jgi:hypothetical protein